MTFDNSNTPISVILVDDHPVVRAGCRRLLESTPDIHVVAEAGNGSWCNGLHRQTMWRKPFASGNTLS